MVAALLVFLLSLLAGCVGYEPVEQITDLESWDLRAGGLAWMACGLLLPIDAVHVLC